MTPEQIGRLSAFPRNIATEYAGMTLRDWFAGQALANARTHFSEHEDTATARDVAIQAYAIADAMLEERDQ